MGTGYVTPPRGTLGDINNCLFESNSVLEGGGGGLYIYYASTNKLRNCVFRGNQQTGTLVDLGGGAVEHTYGAGVTMWNCLVYNNYASTMGGGIYNMKGGTYPLVLYNCTVISNTATYVGGGRGGGIHTRDTTDSVQINNSIVYTNLSFWTTINPDILISGPASFVSNSCVGRTNGLINFGNIITNNPAFVNFAADNFRLTHNSPCVNRGFNQDWMTNAADLDGRMRLRYGTVDMGAYEVIYDGTIYKFH